MAAASGYASASMQGGSGHACNTAVIDAGSGVHARCKLATECKPAHAPTDSHIVAPPEGKHWSTSSSVSESIRMRWLFSCMHASNKQRGWSRSIHSIAQSTIQGSCCVRVNSGDACGLTQAICRPPRCSGALLQNGAASTASPTLDAIDSSACAVGVFAPNV